MIELTALQAAQRRAGGVPAAIERDALLIGGYLEALWRPIGPDAQTGEPLLLRRGNSLIIGKWAPSGVLNDRPWVCGFGYCEPDWPTCYIPLRFLFEPRSES